jgi:DNA-binding CsgD family transcriptional regulator
MPLSRAARLTPREVETATWIARGRTYAEIARLLSITEDTAKFHIENVRRKLGATNRTHAIALALVNCLIRL